MLAAALRDRRVRRSLSVVAVAILVIVAGGILAVASVEADKLAAVLLVLGAVVLLLVVALMTVLVAFLKELQSKATQLLAAHPTERDLDTTRGLLDSLKDFELGADALRDAPSQANHPAASDEVDNARRRRGRDGGA